MRGQMKPLAGLIIGLLGFLVIVSAVLLTMDVVKSSKKLDIQPCKLYLCTAKDVQSNTGGLISMDTPSFCKPHSVMVPRHDEHENPEGLMIDIGRLIALSWEEVCHGPNPNFWEKHGSLGKSRNCFEAFYFEIEPFRGYKAGEMVFTGDELAWDLVTRRYKVLVDESGEDRGYSVTAYVQEYGEPGRIDIMPEEFIVGKLYGIAVVEEASIFADLGILEDPNVPHVVVDEAQLLQSSCI